MYEEGSSLSFALPALLNLDKAPAATVEINAAKLKAMLQRYYSYPGEHRKQIWTYILQLPRNKTEFNVFRSQPILPQARKMCEEKKCGPRVLKLFSALIHWHAPLINCDWLPLVVQKIDSAFGNDPLFCFEVLVTLFVTFFGEWLAEVPGPPPAIITRIEAVLAHYDPDLRDSLGSGLIGWWVYRSCFAETLYDKSWLEVMDVLLSSAPQFLEFVVVGWLVLNGPQIREDPSTFHSTRRPVNCKELMTVSMRVFKRTPASLTAGFGLGFRFLVAGEYPVIEARAETVALRTMQSDYERLEELQESLREESKKANQIERMKERKQETYDAMAQLHAASEVDERMQAAKTKSELENRMKQLKLEGKRLRQNEELAFIDVWQREWDNTADFSSTSVTQGSTSISGPVVNIDDIRMSSMSNIRESDNMLREARFVAVTRGNHARREVEAQAHETELSLEMRSMAANRNLLMRSSAIKKVGSK